MKYRNFPFGYTMKNGKIRVNEKEAETVQMIFREYIGGTALKKIADFLTLCKTEYLPEESQWNKSRVKRVIEDSRYMGNDKYPQIIDRDIFETANIIKLQRKTNGNCIINAQNRPITNSVRCGICGAEMIHITDRRSKNPEKWKCINEKCRFSTNITLETVMGSITQLLNMLIQNLDKIQNIETTDIPDTTKFSEKELYLITENRNMNKKELQEQIFRYASDRYDCDTNKEYITERIRADLKKRGLLSDLSVELFEKIISYTIIDRNGTVSIVLKNGNRIERTEEYDNGYGIRRKKSNDYPDKT